MTGIQKQHTFLEYYEPAGAKALASQPGRIELKIEMRHHTSTILAKKLFRGMHTPLESSDTQEPPGLWTWMF